jgi:N-hydroxyarylamine O-acetyltransferase
MSTIAPVPLDLDAYLARIGHDGNGRLDPNLEVLEALHLAHATHIPFENFDVLLGRPIRLDLESLQAKLVGGGRGGYCFEHNTLFAAVLERLGYEVTLLAARVRLGATEVRPRTHMLLRVDLDGNAYLADVGFGGEMLLKPLPLTPGRETRLFGRTYRLLEDAGQWVLQSLHAEGWFDLYAFTMEPQYAADFEVANYFIATHPSSIFVQHAFAQRTTPEESHLLLDRKLSVRRGDEVSSRIIEDDEELLRVLAGSFGLHFPPGTRFQPPAALLDTPFAGR